MKYKRLIPLAVSLLVLFLNEAFFFWPSGIFVLLSLAIIVMFLGAIAILGQEGREHWLLAISPTLLIAGGSAYSLVIYNFYLIQALFIFSFIYSFWYLRNLYYFSKRSQEKDVWRERIGNLMAAGTFLTAFTAASFAYRLPLFLGWSFLYRLPGFFVFSFLLLFQWSALEKDSASNQGVTAISLLLLMESAWAFSWLPLESDILALIFAIVSYLLLTFVRLEAKGHFDRRSIRLPLAFSILAIILLILTARWL